MATWNNSACRRRNTLSDVLGLSPRTKAKEHLYRLFEELGNDFNGDLFGDDLKAEARLVSTTHIKYLDEFFRSTDAATGQTSFWPYDFAVIPVETISAIYERFLKAPEQRRGAFYTPRFLAELVLDMALTGTSSLLKRRYLDPSCGSGIFLVGIFNRLAEEWKQANPDAENDYRARELRRVLCENLCGIDINPTACRITTFSLCLAYLDHLSPRDIQELRLKGHKLPKLVHRGQQAQDNDVEGNIWCGDFFSKNEECPPDIDIVIGNPPWGSTAGPGSPAAGLVVSERAHAHDPRQTDRRRVCLESRPPREKRGTDLLGASVWHAFSIGALPRVSSSGRCSLGIPWTMS